MKALEFRTLSDAELAKKLKDLKAELFNLRFTNATGSLQNTMAIDKCKKDIAKANTVIRERELGISKAPVVKSSTKSKAEKTTENIEPKKTTKVVKKVDEKKSTKQKKEKAEKIVVWGEKNVRYDWKKFKKNKNRGGC